MAEERQHEDRLRDPNELQAAMNRYNENVRKLFDTETYLAEKSGAVDFGTYEAWASDFQEDEEELIQLILDPMFAVKKEEVEHLSEEEFKIFWAPFHAFMILVMLAPVAAVKPFLQLLKDDDNEELFSHYPLFFESVGRPALPILWEEIKDPSNSVEVQGFCIRMLAIVAEVDQTTTNQVVRELSAYLKREESKASPEEAQINGYVIMALCDLHAEVAASRGHRRASEDPVYKLIEEAFARNIVDESLICLEDVQIEFGLRPLWTEEEREERLLANMAKVKPNHSCPCGSGKKYKKCCMP